MKLSTRMLVRVASASILSVGLSGIAAADSVGLSTTGPDSNNKVTISNTSTNTVTNSNTVEIVNVNEQVASSGDVDVSDNTVADGPISSGNATNNNSTTTTVAIDNTGSVLGTTGGGLGGATGGDGSGNGGSTGATGGSGSVLGASTGGLGGGSVATLPAVGASVPVDVSALRALYHPASITAPTATLVHASKAIPAAFLGLASFLSLLGAALTIVYNRRQKRQTI